MSQAFSNNHNSINIANILNCTAPDDESKILAWLSPLEPRVRHRDIVAQRVDSIGSWLLETEEFRRWKNVSREGEPKHATLFCDGNPGVGKSYIISLVIDKLCDETMKGDTAVTCFYFNFAARNEQSPIDMLGSLLRQLVSGLEEIPGAIVEGFRDQKKAIGGRGLQVSGIVKMFQTITATRRAFICVDALDECVPEHRMVVLESLGQILQGSPNTRIFMTGRPHIRSEVQRVLDGAVGFVLVQPTEDGIVRYLRERLRKDTTPGIMNRALEENIMKSIPEISSETFLLASLHIDAILRETTIARRGKRLKSLKDGVGLGDAYGVTLERIRAQDGEMTKLGIATLTWICHAERPLQVDELCHALAVEIGTEDFDHENVPSIDTLLVCCQGLITVDKESSTVRLIHFTVQEYLCAHPDVFCEPHSIIAEICLTYLNSRQVKDLSTHPVPDRQSMPFLRYSSRYWEAHANYELTEDVRALALEFLNNQEDCVRSTPLSLAAWNGHEGVTRFLLECEEVNPNHRDIDGRTPIWYAAAMGREVIVKLLLERENVDPNHPDIDGRTPLGCAASDGHEGVVKLLLERENVDPNRPDKSKVTPLGWAATRGYEGIVKLLLERENVDPNHPDIDGRTPLGYAASDGHERVVKLFLGRENVDPNHRDIDGQTPLAWAARNGHEGVVRLLLELEKVDPNRADKYDRTPLGYAALSGHVGVVRLLLELENIDPNHPDIDGRTPLWCAAGGGHEGVVELLLDLEKVDPNHSDTDGRTPLWCAAGGGHEGVVELLLDLEKVDPNHPDIDGQTPLGHAAQNGSEGVARILLELGTVDPDCPDKFHLTPLLWAAIRGHEGVVRLLLERKDVDPNRPDTDDRTPLGYAAWNGHEGIVKTLLGRSTVDPNRPDVHGRTPLLYAAICGREGVVNRLQERKDVDLNGSDKYDRTPLRCAALKGHAGVVKLLLERQTFGPNHPDKYDQAPLERATVSAGGRSVELPLELEYVYLNLPNENEPSQSNSVALTTRTGKRGP